MLSKENKQTLRNIIADHQVDHWLYPSNERIVMRKLVSQKQARNWPLLIPLIGLTIYFSIFGASFDTPFWTYWSLRVLLPVFILGTI